MDKMGPESRTIQVRIFLKVAAKSVQNVNSMSDRNIVSYARKAIIRCVLRLTLMELGECHNYSSHYRKLSLVIKCIFELQNIGHLERAQMMTVILKIATNFLLKLFKYLFLNCQTIMSCLCVLVYDTFLNARLHSRISVVLYVGRYVP